jgi:hypothetical protein
MADGAPTDITEAELAALAEKFTAWADSLASREQDVLWSVMREATWTREDVRGHDWPGRPDYSWSSLFNLAPTLLSRSSGDGSGDPRR